MRAHDKEALIGVAAPRQPCPVNCVFCLNHISNRQIGSAARMDRNLASGNVSVNDA
jgi:hypothetical protein